ncbi:hypothetical protein THOM_2309 [Trachipleistophora hominis]|uniref:Uncharacterized protein n=1 Tax=Trachipleistophora hominis TaxID=72359 RepID=L7JTG0_TRAHO|nr:hypothetical protein THOM_2309 [Trachipleistophora hominis]
MAQLAIVKTRIGNKYEGTFKSYDRLQGTIVLEDVRMFEHDTNTRENAVCVNADHRVFSFIVFKLNSLTYLEIGGIQINTNMFVETERCVVGMDLGKGVGDVIVGGGELKNRLGLDGDEEMVVVGGGELKNRLGLKSKMRLDEESERGYSGLEGSNGVMIESDYIGIEDVSSVRGVDGESGIDASEHGIGMPDKNNQTKIKKLKERLQNKDKNKEMVRNLDEDFRIADTPKTAGGRKIRDDACGGFPDDKNGSFNLSFTDNVLVVMNNDDKEEDSSDYRKRSTRYEGFCCKESSSGERYLTERNQRNGPQSRYYARSHETGSSVNEHNYESYFMNHSEGKPRTKYPKKTSKYDKKKPYQQEDYGLKGNVPKSDFDFANTDSIDKIDTELEKSVESSKKSFFDEF